MERVRTAAARSTRRFEDITVVAVSKTMSVDQILAVYEAGHRDFGENRAQELAAKAPQLPSDIRWHFVGALQSNKVRQVRPVAHLLHSMDRLSLAEAWVKGIGVPPPVLLQVNVGSELQKSGVEVTDVDSMLDRLEALGIEVRGLMAIPPVQQVPADSRVHFQELRRLADGVSDRRGWTGELSMGMTEDFEIAIEEGASIIRVGRAIFGPRK